EPMIIALRKGGQIIYKCDLNANKFHQLTIPTNLYGIGIHQLTLFDSEYNPVCERLVFLNADKKLNIHLETDKKEYNPREKVVLKIKVKDEKGNPVKTNFALSVVNEQMLQFA